MKRRVLLLSLLLFAPITPTFSETPPKAGSICAKAGITKNYKGKKYTCTKSGKKLIWNKGVVIKVLAPNPSTSQTPAPIPSPTPTPTPTPKSQDIVNIEKPAIVGLAQVGRTLGLELGSWLGEPPFDVTYTWSRCSSINECAPIQGATLSTFLVTKSDLGFKLRATVIVKNSVYASSMDSALSEIVSETKPPTTELEFNNGYAVLPNASTGIPYSFEIKLKDGNSPSYRAYQSCGKLPKGLSFEGTTLSGTAYERGKFAFCVSIYDADNEIVPVFGMNGFLLTVTGSNFDLTNTPRFTTNWNSGIPWASQWNLCSKNHNGYTKSTEYGQSLALTTPTSNPVPNLYSWVSKQAPCYFLNPNYTSAGWNPDSTDFNDKSQLRNGQDTWYGVKIRFPSDYKAPSSGVNNLVTWNIDGNTAKFTKAWYTMQLAVKSSSYDLVKRQGLNPYLSLDFLGGAAESPSSYANKCQMQQGSLLLDHWYQIAIHVKWDHRQTEGLVEFYADGNRICSLNGSTLLLNPDGTTSNHLLTLRNERIPDPYESTVLFDDFVIGNSLNQVTKVLIPNLDSKKNPSVSAPKNSIAPSVIGSADVGQILRPTLGVWSGMKPIESGKEKFIGYSLQWQQCAQNNLNCADILGATTSEYSVQKSDLGKFLRIAVTASNSYGSSIAYSQSTKTVTQMEIPTITPIAGSTFDMKVGETVSIRFDFLGGSNPTYRLRQSFGNFPEGLTFGERELSGTPTKPGSYAISFNLYDGNLIVVPTNYYIRINVTGNATELPVDKDKPYWWFDFEDGNLMPQGFRPENTGLITIAKDSVQGNIVGLTVDRTSGGYATCGWGIPGCESRETSNLSIDSSLSYAGYATNAEIGSRASKLVIGQDVWYRTKMMIPEYNEFYDTLLIEWHVDAEYTNLLPGGGGYNPKGPFSLGMFIKTDVEMDSDFQKLNPRIVLRLAGGNQDDPIYDSKTCTLPPNSIIKNHWYDFVTHIIWNTDPNKGFVEWWVDGKQICSLNFPTLFKNRDGTSSYNFFGVYNYRSTPDSSSLGYSTYYYDDIAAGPTRKSIKF